MDLSGFWTIIDKARSTAGADVEARPAALAKVLATLSKAELASFQKHYDSLICASYRWDLWGAAYIINGGCSDDSFRYFRDWLISEGREVFDKAVASGDSLADHPHIDCADLELFGYVATDVAERKGFGKLDRDFSTEGAEPAGQQWKEDELQDLFPRLAAKY
ncbi:MAG: DUF4240 domain-containing protein [Alphaproteobacteria bacterium]|nr:DUF4240 domain-containing protein [Alphaproteobacteria bacterium]